MKVRKIDFLILKLLCQLKQRLLPINLHELFYCFRAAVREDHVWCEDHLQASKQALVSTDRMYLLRIPVLHQTLHHFGEHFFWLVISNFLAILSNFTFPQGKITVHPLCHMLSELSKRARYADLSRMEEILRRMSQMVRYKVKNKQMKKTQI